MEGVSGVTLGPDDEKFSVSLNMRRVLIVRGRAMKHRQQQAQQPAAGCAAERHLCSHIPFRAEQRSGRKIHVDVEVCNRALLLPAPIPGHY
jgi:hypothetical protein